LQAESFPKDEEGVGQMTLAIWMGVPILILGWCLLKVGIRERQEGWQKCGTTKGGLLVLEKQKDG
jgi:hypothetical protein